MKNLLNDPEKLIYFIHGGLLILVLLQWWYIKRNQKKKYNIPLILGITSLFLIFTCILFESELLYFIAVFAYVLPILLGIVFSVTDETDITNDNNSLFKTQTVFKINNITLVFFTWVPLIMITMSFVICHSLELWH